MKLIIQIPCLNEAENLPSALADLPRSVPGFQSVEWLVIDDGSSDGTAEIARAHGVDHVVRLPHNQGLAKAFMAGIGEALRLGADVIVNTDADNQYDARFIPDLVAPILYGEAMIVIGARPIDEIAHFSPVKRRLQRLGSWVVGKAGGVDIDDAPSGFRAFHRDAAMRLCVFNSFTYTLETIIQAGRANIPIASVPVAVNGETRPSRLFKGTASYVRRSLVTILRIALLYKPLRIFTLVAALIALPGVAAIARFLAFYVAGDGSGHIQSLAVAAGLISVGAVVFVGGLLADLIAANRMLLEDIRTRQISQTLKMEPSMSPQDLDGHTDRMVAMLRATQANLAAAASGAKSAEPLSQEDQDALMRSSRAAGSKLTG
ncbi:glycosyltransferase family 2 protein [Jiella marina]|uniref:glycosyltransferase family 2 protein n=1 Tax=Jiella sp. LLJ827 TaxID=2917712 RepID=UPI002100A35B|nr:glycosyltransferase family 2 protein [Jiella sp. LLJ827]MCQ0987652.1 glycosyltransferase family 2 protein [Jiella sp. LLJ827]